MTATGANCNFFVSHIRLLPYFVHELLLNSLPQCRRIMIILVEQTSCYHTTIWFEEKKLNYYYSIIFHEFCKSNRTVCINNHSRGKIHIFGCQKILSKKGKTKIIPVWPHRCATVFYIQTITRRIKVVSTAASNNSLKHPKLYLK